jgi:hypothetical protein
VSGRRFSSLPPSLRGGGPAAIDPRRAVAASAGVPLIGAKPHEVRIQIVTSDGAQPTVIEAALAVSGLLVRIENWAGALAALRAGTERQAAALGDVQATDELLELLDGTRQRILAISQAAQNRAVARKAAQEATRAEGAVSEANGNPVASCATTDDSKAMPSGA